MGCKVIKEQVNEDCLKKKSTNRTCQIQSQQKSEKINIPQNVKMEKTTTVKNRSLYLRRHSMRTNLNLISANNLQNSESNYSQMQNHDSIDNRTERSIIETSRLFKRKTECGKKIINQYTYVNHLGKGAQGKVKLAIKNNDMANKYAMKIYPKTKLRKQMTFRQQADGNTVMKNALEDIKMEIAIMKRLDHPNIINMIEIIDDPNQEKIYMIMDYAELGSIMNWDYKKKSFEFSDKLLQNKHLMDGMFVSEHLMRQFFRQCIYGLDYLHKNGIIHQDIKPQNILLNKDFEAIISDFGVSQIIDQDIQDQNLKTPSKDQLHFTQGSLYFMGPEIIKCNRQLGGFSGIKSDIWSLGVTFYCIIYKQFPFYEADISKFPKMLQKKNLRFPKQPKISDQLKSLLKNMLNKNPNKRHSLQKLSHNEWINENSETMLEDLLNQNSIIRSQPILQKEVDNAICPIKQVVIMKKMVSNLLKKLNSKKNNVSPIFSNSKLGNDKTIDSKQINTNSHYYRRQTMSGCLKDVNINSLIQFQKMHGIKNKQQKKQEQNKKAVLESPYNCKVEQQKECQKIDLTEIQKQLINQTCQNKKQGQVSPYIREIVRNSMMADNYNSESQSESQKENSEKADEDKRQQQQLSWMEIRQMSQQISKKQFSTIKSASSSSDDKKRLSQDHSDINDEQMVREQTYSAQTVTQQFEDNYEINVISDSRLQTTKNANNKLSKFGIDNIQISDNKMIDKNDDQRDIQSRFRYQSDYQLGHNSNNQIANLNINSLGILNTNRQEYDMMNVENISDHQSSPKLGKSDLTSSFSSQDQEDDQIQ